MDLDFYLKIHSNFIKNYFVKNKNYNTKIILYLKIQELMDLMIKNIKLMQELKENNFKYLIILNEKVIILYIHFECG